MLHHYHAIFLPPILATVAILSITITLLKCIFFLVRSQQGHQEKNIPQDLEAPLVVSFAVWSTERKVSIKLDVKTSRTPFLRVSRSHFFVTRALFLPHIQHGVVQNARSLDVRGSRGSTVEHLWCIMVMSSYVKFWFYVDLTQRSRKFLWNLSVVFNAKNFSRVHDNNFLHIHCNFFGPKNDRCFKDHNVGPKSFVLWPHHSLRHLVTSFEFYWSPRCYLPLRAADLKETSPTTWVQREKFPWQLFMSSIEVRKEGRKGNFC